MSPSKPSAGKVGILSVLISEYKRPIMVRAIQKKSDPMIMCHMLDLLSGKRVYLKQNSKQSYESGITNDTNDAE